MPDIKIATDVAGRICGLPFEAGAAVGESDDLVFVEAMKKEIPVAAPAALVAIDDVVTKDQLLAILQT
jgi:biotin carboxyl carrier protein